MSTEVRELTEAEKAVIPEYEKKWIDVATNTDPIDFEKAVEAVKLAYRLAECGEYLDNPNFKFHYARSPVEGAKILEDEYNMKGSDILYSSVYGNNDAYWLAFYDFFHEVPKVEGLEKTRGLVEVAKHCGWVAVYDEAAIIMDRPDTLKLDDQQRLHCEDGPAIRYRDGVEIYCYHGTDVPKHWIIPDPKKPFNGKEVIETQNMDLREIGIRILGWDKIFDHLQGQVVDKNPDPEIGTLWKVKMPNLRNDDGQFQILEYRCGTGRRMCSPVPERDDNGDTIDTAVKAQVWMHPLEQFLKGGWEKPLRT